MESLYSLVESYRQSQSQKPLLIENGKAIWASDVLGQIELWIKDFAPLKAGWPLGIYAQSESYLTTLCLLILAQKMKASLGLSSKAVPPQRQQQQKELMEPQVLFEEGRWHVLNSPPQNALPLEQVVLFTSGSTGNPKAVSTNVEKLLLNARAVSQRLEWNDSLRLLVTTPILFTSSLCHLLAAVVSRGTLIVESGFHFPSSLVKKMKTSQATAFGGGPFHIQQMLDQKVTVPGSLQYWLSSGSHLSIWATEQLLQIAPHLHPIVMYGMTEASGRICLLDVKQHPHKKGSVGQPLLPYKLCLDPLSQEISLQSPLLMQGYLPLLPTPPSCEMKLPTGDLGKQDSDGFIWIEGRKDEVFKSGGLKISPSFIDKALEQTGLFKETATVAKEDDFLGLVPCAFVVPRHKESFQLSMVVEALRDQLDAAQIPKKFVTLEQIPRKTSGKIDHHALGRKLET